MLAVAKLGSRWDRAHFLRVTVLRGTVERPGVQENLPNVFECHSQSCQLHGTRWTGGGTRICLIVTDGNNVHFPSHPLSSPRRTLSTALVGFVWSSPKVDVHVDELWDALTLQARNLEKYVAVTDVSVSDDGTEADRILTIKFPGLQLVAVFELSRSCCFEEVPRVEGMLSWYI